MKGSGGAKGVKRATAASAFERTGGVGFGFEAYRATEEFSSPVYVGEEESLKLPFRALLTKKDPTTRIKAMNDLETAFRALPVETVREALPHWCFLFERCQKDNERRVRLACARVILLLLERLPKAMAEKRFDAFGTDWICGCYDPEQDCASVYRSALELANIQMFPDVVVTKLCKYVRQRSPDESFDDFTGGGSSPEELNERSFRVRSQALHALAHVVSKQSASLDLSSLNESSSWFKYLLAGDNDGGHACRIGSYQLLAALASNNQVDVISHSSVMKPVMRIVSEKVRIATPAMWNALLAVGKHCSDFWQNVDALRKGFFPELFRHLERRCNDAGFAALSNLVVFLSLVPETVWTSYGYETFAREWFGKLLGGVDRTVVGDTVILSALECLIFLLRKRVTREVDEGKAFEYLTNEVAVKLVEWSVIKVPSMTPTTMSGDVVSLLLTAINLSEMSADSLKRALVGKEREDLNQSLRFLKVVVGSRSYGDAGRAIQTLVRPCVIEAIKSGKAEEKLVFSLLDASPAILRDQPSSDWTELVHSRLVSVDKLPGVVARMVNAQLISLSEVVQLEDDVPATNDSIVAFLDALVDLGFSPADPKDLAVSSQLVRNIVSDDDESAIKFARFMDPEMQRERLDHLLETARTLVETKAVADSKRLSSLVRAVLAFTSSVDEPFSKRNLYILAAFSGEDGDQFTMEGGSDDDDYVLDWLSSAPNWSEEAVKVRWARLVSKENRPLKQRPHSDLAVALIAEEGASRAAQLLGFPEGGEGVVEMLWWVLQGQSSLPVLLGHKLEVQEWVDDVFSFVFGLSSTPQSTPTRDVLLVTRLFDLIPPHSFHESESFKYIDWVHAALERDSDLVQETLLPLFLSRLRADGIDLQIEQAFVEATLRACFVVAEFQEETAKANNASVPSPTPSPSPSGAEAPKTTVFKSGDAVIYERTPGGDRQAATVVAKHDDGGSEPYYTIRWWAEDRSRETQTTGDRLTARAQGGASKEQLTEEENKKQLVEVQRLLQEARQSGNRPEIVRLMKLQQDLAPKPKDTEEEKAKAEAARLKAEQEWREKRKARGLLADDDDDDADKDQEEVSTTTTTASREWSFPLRFGLKFLSRSRWRFADDSPMPVSPPEREAMERILSPSALVWIPIPQRGGEDLKTLAKVLVVNPEWTSASGEFVSKTISVAARVRDSRICAMLCREFAAVVSDTAAGRILVGFASSSSDDDSFASEVAGSMLSLRVFPARLVWMVAEDLFSSRLVKARSLEEVLAAFVCLYRYPVKLSGREERDNEDSDVDNLVDVARGFFPLYLLDSLVETLSMVETQRDDEEDNQEGVVDRLILLFLQWLLVLRYIQIAWKMHPARSRDAIVAWLRRDDLVYSVLGMISSLLVFSEEMNPLVTSVNEEEESVVDDAGFVVHSLRSFQLHNQSGDDAGQIKQNPQTTTMGMISKLASRCFFQTVHVLPAQVREWWMNHLPNRFDKEGVSRFTATFVTPNVLKTDMLELNDAVRNRAWDPSELSVKFSLSTRVVTIASFKDDCTLEMEISFPDTYPLFPAKVECTKQIGVKQDKWKRWALQIVMLLGKRDGTLSDAVQLWKQNLDKEFEGVEPCPICYSVLHAVDSSLPRVTCKTCKNVFHGKCLSQWFTSSHQSLCPLCKQSFMASANNN